MPATTATYFGFVPPGPDIKDWWLQVCGALRVYVTGIMFLVCAPVDSTIQQIADADAVLTKVGALANMDFWPNP